MVVKNAPKKEKISAPLDLDAEAEAAAPVATQYVQVSATTMRPRRGGKPVFMTPAQRKVLATPLEPTHGSKITKPKAAAKNTATKAKARTQAKTTAEGSFKYVGSGDVNDAQAPTPPPSPPTTTLPKVKKATPAVGTVAERCASGQGRVDEDADRDLKQERRGLLARFGIAWA